VVGDRLVIEWLLERVSRLEVQVVQLEMRVDELEGKRCGRRLHEREGVGCQREKRSSSSSL